MAKRRKLDPKRFNKQDGNGVFSFDPVRRSVFMWGAIAGAAGGFFMLRPEIFWQIVGVFAVVLLSNHHINKASRRIPRWHAALISFLGVTLALFGIIILGTVFLTYFQSAGSNGG